MLEENSGNQEPGLGAQWWGISKGQTEPLALSRSKGKLGGLAWYSMVVFKTPLGPMVWVCL